jgi:hypothetical protein
MQGVIQVPEPIALPEGLILMIVDAVTMREDRDGLKPVSDRNGNG